MKIYIISIFIFFFSICLAQKKATNVEIIKGTKQTYSPLGEQTHFTAGYCDGCESKTPPEGHYPTFGSGSVGFGISPDGEVDGKPGVLQKSGNLLTKLIDKIPDKGLKNGLAEYLKIVNPNSYEGDDVGVSNNGLVNFFHNRFVANSCFRSAAVNFYKDIATTLKKKNTCEPSIRNSHESAANNDHSYKDSDPLEACYGCLTGRSSLDDKAGIGSKSNLDEGWIFRLAMKHSKGNPQAAMELIAMCGHDDTAQGSFAYFDDSEEALRKNAEYLQILKEKKKSTDKALKESFKKFDVDQDTIHHLSQQSAYQKFEIDTISKSKGRQEFLVCPPAESDYYLPGSLSDKADISGDLKSKIKSIQSEGRTNPFIPAKHYHVYGSAFLGCKMVQNGMSPDQAVLVQKNAARFYRGLRMCEASKMQLDKRNDLKSKLNVKDFNNSKEIEVSVLKLWNERIDQKLKCNNPFLMAAFGFPMETKAESNSMDQNKCKMLAHFGILDLNKNEEDIVKRKINAAIGRYDAAKLYNDWYVGGDSFAGIKTPCTDHRNKGPSDLMNPNNGIMGKLFKPNGWSKERYEAASRKLATWDVDFEWTVAQHEVGSQFGAKICSEAKNKKNPFEEASCSDMKNKQGNEFLMPGQGIMPNNAVK